MTLASFRIRGIVGIPGFWARVSSADTIPGVVSMRLAKTWLVFTQAATVVIRPQGEPDFGPRSQGEPPAQVL